MAIKPVSTPLRRSRRGQPIVSAPSNTFDPHATPFNLPDLSHKRMTCSEDLYEEDINALNDREIPLADLETHFYDSFSRNSISPSTVKRGVKIYGKKIL